MQIRKAEKPASMSASPRPIIPRLKLDLGAGDIVAGLFGATFSNHHRRGDAADFAERAFERFSRAEESRTSSGAGLGLAIVAAVAEAHSGSATVGEGAVVSVRVPAEPSSAPVQPRSPRRYLPSSRSTALHFPS